MLNENFNNESDIDLIVDFENLLVEDYVNNYFKFSLENILKRPIDSLEEKAIKNPYFRQTVNQQKHLIYGYEVKGWLYIRYSLCNWWNWKLFADRPKRFGDYQKDIFGQKELLREILKLQIREKVVDVRNRIIHGYDSVSDDIIWGIIIKFLPTLKTETGIFLKKWTLHTTNKA